MVAGKSFKEEEKCHLEAGSRFLKCLLRAGIVHGPKHFTRRPEILEAGRFFHTYRFGVHGHFYFIF